MTADHPSRRKVIPGSQVFFEEDVTFHEEPLAAPLLLPPLPPFDELVILCRDQFFHLVETGAGPDRFSLGELSFALVPFATARALEEQYLQAHAPALAACRTDFLRALHSSLVDEAGTPARTTPTRQAAALALEKLKRLAAAGPAHAPKAPTPPGHLRPPAEVSVLATALPDWDRTLFLDGRCYDLLTTREFFESWQRGFHPDIVEQVKQRPTPWPAAELSAFLTQNAARANARALSVVRSGLHAPHRPVQIHLDGLDFVPVHRGQAAVFGGEWLRALADDLKRRVLEEFLV